MKRYFKPLTIFFPIFLLTGYPTPSWAGFRGRFGIVIGPGFWPGPYYGPSYDPYYAQPPDYYGYYPYDPYVYVPYAQEQPRAREVKPAQPDDSRHDLTYIDGQINRAREGINYDYDDGDITKDQRKMALHHLKEVFEEADAMAKDNGGYITGDEEKELLNEIRGGPRRAYPSRAATAASVSSANLGPIRNQISQLRTLLDKKLSDGKITKAQHDGMMDYLARTEKQARSQAVSNGGSLTQDQEEAVREQLDRVEHSIQQNLVTN